MRSANLPSTPDGDQRYFRANQSHPIRDQRSRRRHGRRHKEVEVGAGLADQAGKAWKRSRASFDSQPNSSRKSRSLSKQQVRGTEGVANAMQIISGITRQTSQSARQAAGRLATW